MMNNKLSSEMTKTYLGVWKWLTANTAIHPTKSTKKHPIILKKQWKKIASSN